MATFIVRLAIAAHCEVARVGAQIGALAAAYAAVAQADCLVTALATPWKPACWPKAPSYSSMGMGMGDYPSPSSSIAPPVLAGSFDLTHLTARSAVSVEPQLRADVLHAAGLLHECAGATAAAEAQYAAALAVDSSHTPSLVRLADCELTAALKAVLPPAARAALESGMRTTERLPVSDDIRALAEASRLASPATGSDVRVAVDDALRRLDSGRHYVNTALRNDPHNHAAWGVLARIEAAAGNHEEAASASLMAMTSKANQALLSPALLPLRTPLWT